MFFILWMGNKSIYYEFVKKLFPIQSSYIYIPCKLAEQGVLVYFGVRMTTTCSFPTLRLWILIKNTAKVELGGFRRPCVRGNKRDILLLNAPIDKQGHIAQFTLKDRRCRGCRWREFFCQICSYRIIDHHGAQSFKITLSAPIIT